MENPLSTMVGSTDIASGDLLWLVFYVATLLFTIHAVIVAYHWFTFGTSRRLATTAVSVYVATGALILIIAATTISLIT